MTFDSYTKAEIWIANRVRAYGGKQKFYASEEYKNAYSAIKAAYDAEQAQAADEATQRYIKAGYNHGDTVSVVVGQHMIYGPIVREAVLDLKGKEPVAKLVDGWRPNGRKRAIRNIKFPRIMKG